MIACFSSEVPVLAVYLVKFASMARLPACLTCSGVGKSGSPAPRSMTSNPCLRRFSAATVPFMVGDDAIRDIRAANM